MTVRPSSRRCRSSHGFTLIEIMVVVGIVAILSAIAYPSYRDYIVRGRLVDATNGLATMRADMERHFQDNRDYRTVGAIVSPCLRNGGTQAGDFLITCSAGPTLTTYTLAATGGAASMVNGFVLSVNELDQRSTVAPSGWTTCATRWITKKGDPCL